MKQNTNKVDVLLLIASSGSGKDFLKDHLLNNFSQYYIDAISCTTRAMRVGEKEGENYFYKTKEEFSNLLTNKMLIEHVSFHGNDYGVSRDQIDKGVDQGKTTILIVEDHGLVQILDYFEDINSQGGKQYNLKIVFLDIDRDILRKNMAKRGDTPEMIESRLASDTISANMNQKIDNGSVSPDLIVRELLDINVLAKMVNDLVIPKEALIFTGPSGTGKSTMEEIVVDEYDYNIIKSYTTREKRPNEGDDTYHFTDIDTFNSLDLFNIIDISDTWKYGTSRNDINAHKLVYSVIDVEPALTMKGELEKLGYFVTVVALDLPQEERIQLIKDRNESTEDAKLRFEREKNISVLEQFRSYMIEPDYSFVGLGSTKREYVDIILNK